MKVLNIKSLFLFTDEGWWVTERDGAGKGGERESEQDIDTGITEE